MQHNTFIARRVSRVWLIVMLAVLSVPSLAMTGRTASARVPLPAAAIETAAPVVPAPASAESRSALDPAAWHDVLPGNADATVFSLALESAAAAIERGDVKDPSTLTVIDFSKPSTTKRMWVYDLRARTLLFEEVVSHGRNSGENVTTTFSNEPESNKSSLGLFRGAESYTGKHGYSLRLDGLEPGFNDNARSRAIVVHGAEYVNPATAQVQGRLGRSLGCPAVRPEIARQVIDAMKGGGLVFAYYPDPAWLAASTYLN